MILDENGLSWRQVSSDQVTNHDSGAVSSMTLYRCVEHPRVSRVVQRANVDEPWIETFHLVGLPQFWHSAGDAVKAMEENPCS